MKMHRVGKVADWETVSPDAHNIWQRYAHRTNGWVTPGNIVSVLGLFLVLVGLGYILAGKNIFGFVLVGLGRCADILDGMLADRTGTKSPLGEAIDATSDKITLLAALLVFFAVHMIPPVVIFAVGCVNLAIALLSIRARMQHIHLHPSRMGKLATVVQWFGMVLYILAAIIAVHAVSIVAYIVMIISVGMALVAFTMYAWHLFMRKRDTLVRAQPEAE